MRWPASSSCEVLDIAVDVRRDARSSRDRIQRSSAGNEARFVERRRRVRRAVLELHDDESRGVPELVGEVARRLDLLFQRRWSLPVARGGDQLEAHRVGAVPVDQHRRVDDVALRLAHLRGPGRRARCRGGRPCGRGCAARPARLGRETSMPKMPIMIIRATQKKMIS